MNRRLDIGGLLQSATLRVAAITSVGMLLGLGVDALVASRLGAGGAVDALVLGLTIPFFVETILREGSKFSLVPVVIQKARESPDADPGVSPLVNLGIVCGMGLWLLLAVASAWLIRLISPGLDGEALARAHRVMLLALPLIPASVVANVLGAYLNSLSSFAFPAARYLVVAAVVLGGALVLGGTSRLPETVAGLYSLAYLAYATVLWAAATRRGFRHAWRSWMPRQEAVAIIRHLSWPFGGFMAGQAMRIVERSIASTIEPGAVALYYFAFRVFNAIRNVVGMSTAIVGMPALTRSHMDNDADSQRRGLRSSVTRVLVFVVPLVGVLLAAAGYLISLVFERGEFGSLQADSATILLRIMVIGLVFFSVAPVLMSSLYSRSRQRSVFVVMTLTAAANLALALVLVPVFGLPGLAAAFAASSVINVGAGWVLVRR